MEETDKGIMRGATDKPVKMICKGCNPNTHFETNHPEWFKQSMVRGQLVLGKPCPRGCGSQRVYPIDQQTN